jgi:hypothetical protein
MKTYPLMLVALLVAVAAYAQPTPLPPPAMPVRGLRNLDAPPPAAPVKDPVNYLIRVEWKAPKADSKFLEVLTTEGQFNLTTIEKNPVKINNSEVPIPLKFTGTLTPLNDDKARLQLFLGRTVPYVTGTTMGGGSLGSMSTYQQMSIGLDSTFVVKFGKPVTIQNDENGQISVLVKRAED